MLSGVDLLGCSAVCNLLEGIHRNRRNVQRLRHPRFIRLRDAPQYLGMDKNRFNRDVPRATRAATC
jgi:hypothetical protein